MSSTQDHQHTYGPSALVTPANAITVVRLLLSPFMFVLIIEMPVSWWTWVAWGVMAGSDGVDGWVARKQGSTRSGAFLDPFADKVLILGGLAALASIGRFLWIPVAIIAAREIVISLYRTYWVRHGISVPAIKLAKAKTFAQVLAVGLAVWPPSEEYASWTADLFLWLALALAIISGAQYLIAGSQMRGRTGESPDAGGEPANFAG